MTADAEPVQTTAFLSSAPPTFYQAKVTFKHWQLRSLLCSPTPALLYYPSNQRIYSLDTATRKRRLIATLPFSPRCIGARYGWICAGGVQEGHFATIRVGKGKDGEGGEEEGDTGFAGDLEYLQDQWMYGPSKVNIKKLGGLIVNSVTLHRPPRSESDEDVLAVLTNNDKTVRIFHLGENRVVSTLHVDVPTNHASISPDGKHLVVVGDAPTVYFYHPAAHTPGAGAGIGESACGSWVMSSHPPLRAGSLTDALMSTSFSPSSIHCAVASQAGIITIFDTRYLSGDHDRISPIVRVISSSRANSGPGAVRSIHFSPAPWDLLIWAEHCGRICISDARNNFATRQIIDIPADHSNAVEAEIEDVQDMPTAWDISQSLLGNRPIYSQDEDPRDDRFDPETDSPIRPRSVEEMQDYVLDNSHEWLAYTSRIRNLAPQSLYHSTSPLADLIRQPLRSTSTAQPTLLRNYRERQLERERARQRYHDPPRRRNSIHPSYGYQENPGPPAPNPALVWSSSAGERDRTAPGLEGFAITSFMAEQRRQRRADRFGGDLGAFGVVSQGDGADISGCTLSPDGKKLYVATPKGVLEYTVNLVTRKVFPLITPR